MKPFNSLKILSGEFEKHGGVQKWKLSKNELILLNGLKKYTNKKDILNYSGWTNSLYQNNTSSLRWKMLNFLFSIKPNKITPVRNAYLECNKMYSLIKILNAFSLKSLAVDLAKRTLKKSMEYDFTDISFLTSRFLVFHFGSVSPQEKYYYYYLDHLEKLNSNIQAELQAEKEICNIVFLIQKSKGDVGKLYSTIRESVKRLDSYKRQDLSSIFFLPYFNLKTFADESIKDYCSLIQSCEEALEYFNSKPYETPSATKTVFLLKIVIANIYLNEYNSALHTAQKILEITYPIHKNYGIALHFKIIILFKQQQYNEITSVINQSEHQKGFVAELMGIYRGYINLLAVMDNELRDIDLPKFKLSKFLNESPQVSKDKYGFNILLITLQLLFLLTLGTKGRDRIADKVESLQQYLRTYLRGRKEVERTRLFIKMLLLLPKCSYRRVVVKHRTKVLLKQLYDTPVQLSGQIRELEIVDYTKLWDLVLKML